jgi:S-formylglutathione hydrolase FrmB
LVFIDISFFNVYDIKKHIGGNETMAILTATYTSACINRPTTFTAIIPFEKTSDVFHPHPGPCRADVKLKSLYLLHGILGNHQDWILNTNLTELAEKYQVAIILPSGDNSFYVDNYEDQRYGEFIGKELVEVSRTLFPLSRNREDTFIAGLSMGGYGALRNGIKYNETFSHAAGLSSALVFYFASASTNEALYTFQKRYFYEKTFGDLNNLIGSDMDLEALINTCTNPPKLFMAIGREDFLYESNQRFRSYLETMGSIDFTYEEGPGNHTWDFWRTYLDHVLQWLPL